MGETSAPAGLSFADFLERMKDPAAADLVRNIKSFIRHFEERPAGAAVDPEADSAKVQGFLAQSEGVFRAHPVWRGCPPEVLDQAVEGLEKYVMSKVWRHTYATWQEDRERDERHQRLMQALGFVDLPTLMGAQVQPDDNLLALAQAEVLKMERYKAPRDKLLCLVNVKTMVENIVGLAAKAGANIGGADAFFPAFLFVVIRSRLPRLASNVEYIKRYRARARLCGQFDYMLCNLESAAMYLDTVNYEHLAVSQQQFLGHLAAAGIPEAHLELHRMQQEAAAAAAEAQLAKAQQVQAPMSGVTQPPLPDGGPPALAAASVARAAASGAAAAQARHEQQEADLADAADVLAGLQLAEGEDAGAAGSARLEVPHTSLPATPLASTPTPPGGEGEASVSREGSLPTLTPLGGASQSPEMVEAAGGSSSRSGGTAAAAPHQQQQQQQEESGSALRRGLMFDAPADPAAEVAAATAAAEQQWRQQEAQAAAAAVAQQQEAAAMTAAAVAAAAAAEAYEEAALIEEMIGEGTRHVLAAEAAGQLQCRYPLMYAQAEDLSLAEVQAVLVGYKELLLRYEALSRALQHQLGLGSNSGGDSGGNAAGVAAARPPLSSSPGHRSKGQQQAAGFGSLVLTGTDAGQAIARRVASAPMPVAAGAAACDGGSADASPIGKWSPGGLLQRIASKGRRSQTPPKDRNGAAADAGAAGSRSPPSGRAASSGRPSQAPFFSTLFGSPKAGTQQQQLLLQQQQQQQGDGAGKQAGTPEGGLSLEDEVPPTAAAPAAAEGLPSASVPAGEATSSSVDALLSQPLPPQQAAQAAPAAGAEVAGAGLIQLDSGDAAAASSSDAWTSAPAPAAGGHAGVESLI